MVCRRGQCWVQCRLLHALMIWEILLLTLLVDLQITPKLVMLVIVRMDIYVCNEI